MPATGIPSWTPAATAASTRARIEVGHQQHAPARVAVGGQPQQGAPRTWRGWPAPGRRARPPRCPPRGTRTRRGSRANAHLPSEVAAVDACRRARGVFLPAPEGVAHLRHRARMIADAAPACGRGPQTVSARAAARAARRRGGPLGSPAGSAGAPPTQGARPSSSTIPSATTTCGSNWLPAQRRISDSACAAVRLPRVGAGAGHRVERVADEDDAGAERDALAGEAVRVARRRRSARGWRGLSRRPLAARAPPRGSSRPARCGAP